MIPQLTVNCVFVTVYQEEQLEAVVRYVRGDTDNEATETHIRLSAHAHTFVMMDQKCAGSWSNQ